MLVMEGRRKRGTENEDVNSESKDQHFFFFSSIKCFNSKVGTKRKDYSSKKKFCFHWYMSNFFKQPRSHRFTNNWGVGDLALPLAGCGVVGQASLPHLQSESSITSGGCFMG